MIVKISNFLYFILLVLNTIKPRNTQLSSLQNSLANTPRNRDLAKSLLNSLPIFQRFPKFTKMNLPASAIAAFQAGNENEDKDLNITQLITKNGFKVVTHEVVTDDGYKLGMFQIPNNGPPVLLVHGFLSSSDDFVTNGRNSSLPFLLADKGFDVWMGDARGSKHSKKHVTLDPVKDKEQFWDFSWDEIGRYDLPAMIDHILDTTGYQQLIYIGHSQGCTSFYVLCSEKPEYNKKIKKMIALAPPVFVAHSTSLVLRAIARVAYYENAPLIKLLGPELFADDLEAVLKSLVCDDATDVVRQLVCTGAIFLVFGFNYEQAHYERLPTILKHLVASVASKQLVHTNQGYGHEKFKKFDYGLSKNEIMYGSSMPPEYPLENCRAPMEIFHGNNDWVNNIKDVQKLLSSLPNANYTFHEVPNKYFAHLDFLFARDVKTLVYDDVIKSIDDNMSQLKSDIK